MTFFALPRPSASGPLWRKLEQRERERKDAERIERMLAENARIQELRRAQEQEERQERERLTVIDPPSRMRHEILREVAARHGLTVADLRRVCRKRYISHARQEAMYLLRIELRLSWQQVGQVFGKDHTTALYAVRVFAKRNGLPES